LSLPLQAQDSLRIRFQLFYGNEPLEWGKKYVTSKADTISIHTCKVYLSKFAITYQNKVQEKIPNSFYLIDFSELNSTEISLPSSKNIPVKSVRCCIGIDSISNTLGAQSGALDPTLGMYWSWQSGYINWKIEGTSLSSKTRKNVFQFHIGGYLPPNLAVRTVTFEPQKGINNHVVRVQLDELFNQIRLKETNTIMIPGKPANELANLFKTCFHYQQ